MVPPRTLFLPALLAAVAVASTAHASGGKHRGHDSDRDETRQLTAVDLRHGIAPHERDIGQCYKRFALPASGGTGELRLQLIVHRDGSVFRLSVIAPGVPKKAHKRLQRCIEDSAKHWRFAQRRGFTDAVIPYLYQRTRTPGSGPLRSCWNPKGCPELRGRAAAN